METQHNISEEKCVNREEIEQRIFDIRYEKEIKLQMKIIITLEINLTKEY